LCARTREMTSYIALSKADLSVSDLRTRLLSFPFNIQHTQLANNNLNVLRNVGVDPISQAYDRQTKCKVKRSDSLKDIAI
jgi:hypothetical protein